MGDSAAGLEALSSADFKRPAPRVIAVDGSAAAGKSTVGRKLAERLGYPFLDTGLMYRAVTLAARERGVDGNDPQALTRLANSIRIKVGPAALHSRETCSISIDGKVGKKILFVFPDAAEPTEAHNVLDAGHGGDALLLCNRQDKYQRNGMPRDQTQGV